MKGAFDGRRHFEWEKGFLEGWREGVLTGFKKGAREIKDEEYKRVSESLKIREDIVRFQVEESSLLHLLIEANKSTLSQTRKCVRGLNPKYRRLSVLARIEKDG